MSEHETIKMTVREQALHQAGIAIGTAHGLEQAAKALEAVAAQLAAHPAPTAAKGQQDAALAVLSRGGKGFKQALSDLRRLGNVPTELQSALLENLKQTVANVRVVADTQRQQFGAHLARAASPATAKNQGLLTTFVQNLARELSKRGG